MISKTRTVKRALRMIGVNYSNVTTNKKIIEDEAYDVFKDIVDDILANKNYMFNVKRYVPSRAPDDPKLEEAGIFQRRYYIPADFLNLVETNDSSLDIEGGYFVVDSQTSSLFANGIYGDVLWVKYCFDGDESLLPEYFARYIALELAFELSMIFYPSDLEKQSKLDRQAKVELVAIDRTQMINKPIKPDGSDTHRLVEVRGRR